MELLTNVLISALNGAGIGLMIYLAKNSRPDGEMFEPLKLARTLFVSAIVALAAKWMGYDLTSQNWLEYIAANSGVIMLGDQLFKMLWNYIKRIDLRNWVPFIALGISYLLRDAVAMPLDGLAIIFGTAGAWTMHDKIKEYAGDGTVDYDDNSFKCALHLVGSNAMTTSVDPWASITNEHTAGNGYTAGGEALTSVTWVESSGTVTLDADDIVWNASGGDIVARFAVIYDDSVSTPVVDPVVCSCLLDDTPADVTAPDGNPLTIELAGTGIFTKS